MKISGEFTVSLNPLDNSFDQNSEVNFGRMSIDKTYEGDMSGQGKGEMLSARTTKGGSAGYVALEYITGSLNGKSGSFVLQHYGIMRNGENQLVLEVVPDSGSGELAGITGKMMIEIKEGKHYYEFDYQLD